MSAAGQGAGSLPANADSRARRRKLWLEPGLAPELRARFQDPESALLAAIPLKNSASTTAGLLRIGEESFFIKRANCASWKDRIRRLGGLSRAERNRIAAERIAVLGIRVPRTLATLTTFPWGLAGASYLVTEAFPPPVSLAERIGEVSLKEPPAALIGELAALAAKLHDHGLIHGDLKLQNVLALPDNGRLRLGLFDFDGTRWYSGIVPFRKRKKELARIASSLAICARNSQWPELPPEEWLNQLCSSYSSVSSTAVRPDGAMRDRTRKLFERYAGGKHAGRS